MAEFAFPTPPRELTEDEEVDAANRDTIRRQLASYREMVIHELAGIAAWAAERQRDDDARRRKFAIARTQRDLERCSCGAMTLARGGPRRQF